MSDATPELRDAVSQYAHTSDAPSVCTRLVVDESLRLVALANGLSVQVYDLDLLELAEDVQLPLPFAGSVALDGVVSELHAVDAGLIAAGTAHGAFSLVRIRRVRALPSDDTPTRIIMHATFREQLARDLSAGGVTTIRRQPSSGLIAVVAGSRVCILRHTAVGLNAAPCGPDDVGASTLAWCGDAPVVAVGTQGGGVVLWHLRVVETPPDDADPLGSITVTAHEMARVDVDGHVDAPISSLAWLPTCHEAPACQEENKCGVPSGVIVAGHAEGLFRAIQLNASHGTAAVVASVVAAPLEGATSLSVITDAPPLPSVPKPAEKGEGGGRGRSVLSALAAPNGRPTVFSQTFSAAHTRWLLCAAAGSRYVLPLPWGRDGDAAVFPSLQEVFNLSRLELGAEARRDARRSMPVHARRQAPILYRRTH